MVSWETVISLPVVQGPVLTPLLGTKELSKELPGKLYPCPCQSTPRWLQTLPLPSSTRKCVAALPTGSLPPTLMDFWPLSCSVGPLGHSFFWKHCALAPETPLPLFSLAALTSPLCWLRLLLWPQKMGFLKARLRLCSNLSL